MCYITQNAPYKITVDFMHSCRSVCPKRSCDKSKFTLLIFLSKTLLWNTVPEKSQSSSNTRFHKLISLKFILNEYLYTCTYILMSRSPTGVWHYWKIDILIYYMSHHICNCQLDVCHFCLIFISVLHLGRFI